LRLKALLAIVAAFLDSGMENGGLSLSLSMRDQARKNTTHFSLLRDYFAKFSVSINFNYYVLLMLEESCTNRLSLMRHPTRPPSRFFVAVILPGEPLERKGGN
jgi:hypothetical protein